MLLQLVDNTDRPVIVNMDYVFSVTELPEDEEGDYRIKMVFHDTSIAFFRGPSAKRTMRRLRDQLL